MEDLHVSQAIDVPVLAELNRISTHFIRHIALHTIESKKQTERLYRFASLVPYALVVHLFNRQYPLFVSHSFFDFAGTVCTNQQGCDGRRYIETLYYSENFYGMGKYALHFRLMPAQDVFIRWQFRDSVTGLESSLLSCSRTLYFTGNAPYVVLTLLAPDTLYVEQYAANKFAVDTKLTQIMSLSAAEYRVFSFMRQNLSNREMAAQLCLGISTVRTHKAAILKKGCAGY